MDEPTVSVIIPMYNDSRTIGLCLSAALSQTYPPVEVIVVDDVSTDDSAAVAAAHPCTLIRSDVNGGPGGARNLGVRHAKGDVFFFVDADVAMSPDAVANAVRLLSGPEGYGAVFGVPDKVPLFPEGPIGQYRILQYHYWRKSAEGPVSGGFYALGAVTREAFERAGWFNPALRQTEEIDHAERLSAAYPMLLTSRIGGRLSDENRLAPILSKAFRRSRLRVPFYLQRGRAMQGMETGSRAFAAVLAAVVLAGLPVALVHPPAVVPLGLLLTLFVAVDFGQYAFVRRERGPAFTAFFTGVHLLMNAAVVCGLAVGVLEWTVRPSFRRMYRGVAS
ncbi:glycosyltransferase family 2 protein [Pseudosporangium ferrugineum]|uniref:Glycosyltransferase involved in cell wall biosynthesis n=1 Tax=Pseudosporangium ferrugineum TaxID=439699 RepID=A0A2T0S8T5_9ACTN|nr:glycosyltransferase family 2 protein [Pseudosporangium ferrugineum]PRY29838.1 glycosyltransferase involved in cell wall biosynthesis [Pseudosporangium ferrugineum]